MSERSTGRFDDCRNFFSRGQRVKCVDDRSFRYGHYGTVTSVNFHYVNVRWDGVKQSQSTGPEKLTKEQSDE